jgi:hypothetical protein
MLFWIFLDWTPIFYDINTKSFLGQGGEEVGISDGQITRFCGDNNEK